MAPLSLEDIEPVLTLERSCFSNPWPRSFFEEELNHPHSFNLTFKINDPGRDQARIIAYISYRVQFDEMQIFKIAVDPRVQGRGTGSSLLVQSLSMACDQGAALALIEVRASNDKAIKMYGNAGFAIVGRRPNYYKNISEDALIMTKQLR
jgi:ribosomal-protein-alanine N-acetyltransferase